MGHIREVAAADRVELIRHCRVLSFVVATEAEEGRHLDRVVLLAPVAFVKSLASMLPAKS